MITVKVGETRRVPIIPEKVEEAEIHIGEKMIIRRRDGVTDYALLENRPAINSHTLNGGENSLASIGLGLASSADINNLFT